MTVMHNGADGGVSRLGDLVATHFLRTRGARMSGSGRIVSRAQVARALHRATCGCAPGLDDLQACVLGPEAGWAEDAARLESALEIEAAAEPKASVDRDAVAKADTSTKREVRFSRR
jgi:hypothetical protein